MYWRILQPDIRPRARFSRGNPSVYAAYDPDVAQRCADFAAAGQQGKRVLILRTLIEDFGGEATSSSLSRRSFSQFRLVERMEAPSRIQIRAVLDQLEASGSVTLERHGENDVIARITAAGASLAYAGTAFEAG